MAAMDSLNTHTTVTRLPLTSLDERYKSYRLIVPKAEDAMVTSMEQYGQFTPIVVGDPGDDGRYLLVDGFKRLRACQKLGYTEIKSTIFEAGDRALKSVMFHLNRKARSMTPLEEAMIVHALHNEDKLPQNKIGELLGFHKSWVCRRIALIEHLDEEILDQVRLGLIGPGIIRELTRLPRGNQKDALETIRKHQMTCRETAQLVTLLLQKPRWEHNSILYFPEPILSQREPTRPPVNTEFNRTFKELSKISKRCAALLSRLQEKAPLIVPSPEQTFLVELFSSIEEALQDIKVLAHLTESSNEDF